MLSRTWLSLVALISVINLSVIRDSCVVCTTVKAPKFSHITPFLGSQLICQPAMINNIYRRAIPAQKYLPEWRSAASGTTTPCFPDNFKEAFITPVMKKLGFDPTNAVFYRPISNTTDLTALVEKHGLSPHQYPDDTQIYGSCSPSQVDECSSKVSGCVNEVAGWMRSNRLQLNPERQSSCGAHLAGVSTDY